MLDVPTGIDSTTDKCCNNYIKPDLTLTLVLPKTGLLPHITGELYLGDIRITKLTIQKVLPDFNDVIFKRGYLIKLISCNEKIRMSIS